MSIETDKHSEPDHPANLPINHPLPPEILSKLSPVLVARIQAPDVVAVIIAPDRQTSRESHFNLGARDLYPGQTIIVLLPESVGILKDAILGHRKRQKFWNLAPGENRKSHDNSGAYSRVRVFDQASEDFKEWIDPKGYEATKFAERRTDTEYEDLHDWAATVGKITPLAIEISSMGTDPRFSVVTEESLDVITYPDEPELSTEEHIFSPGTAFSNFSQSPASLPHYGGGKHEGGYPEAIPLGGKNGKEHFGLTEQLNTEDLDLDESGRLHIKLKPGLNIQCIEVAIGDTWFNYKSPGQLQLGWSKLNMTLKRHDGTEDQFVQNMNIPPQGILSGGFSDPKYITQPGDEIVISSTNTSYLMGVRTTFTDSHSKAVSEAADEATIGSIFSDGNSANPGLSNDAVFSPTDQVLAAESSYQVPSFDFSNAHLVPTGEGAGTQGGQWYVDESTGNRFFGKDYKGNRDRCATEYIASSMYNALGVPCVQTYLHNNKAFAPEAKGITFYKGSKYDTGAVRTFFNHPDIRKGFVYDAWLANWDMFGLDYDNPAKTDDGHILRMDTGGSLFYRAMGKPKPSFANAEVTEIDIMRNPAQAREAGHVFQDITDDEIRSQVQHLQTVMTDEVIKKIVQASGISNETEVIQALIKRRDWLVEHYL